MELSISSSAAYGIRKNGKLQFLPEFGIRQCAQAGFTRMEYNFLIGDSDNRPLSTDNWKDWILRLKDVLSENNITVPNTHAYWFLMSDVKGPEDISLKEKMLRRSVEATAMLGAKQMVVHTQSIFDSDGYNIKKSNAYNREFFSEIGDLAVGFGFDLLVENVFPIPGSIGNCCYPEEMAELMQLLNDPMFGICWDFGHANMAKVDHEKSLDIIAPWLRLLHIADNNAVIDEHTIPGYGNIPWDKVMKKLKEIGYAGDLNLNVRTFAQTTLPHQQVDALKLLRSIGLDLIRMFREA